MNCYDISANIKTIKSLKNRFDDEFEQGNIQQSLNLKEKLIHLIEELEEEIWPLETMTQENIQRQYDRWQEFYQHLGPEYKSFPDKKRVIDFLRQDLSFLEMMKTKEKQGFTKMIMAPAPGFYSFKSLAGKISQEIKKCGGSHSSYFGMWSDMINFEKEIFYFSSIDDSFPVDVISRGGILDEDMKNDPEKYSICDGWMISFTTDEQNMSFINQSDLDTGDGRFAIKTGLTPMEYNEKYFSDKNKMYTGEKSIIPQEYLALIAKDIYEKYIATNKKIIAMNLNLLGGLHMRFVDTYIQGHRSHLPEMSWNKNGRLVFESSSCGSYGALYGVRSVVRRNLKAKI